MVDRGIGVKGILEAGTEQDPGVIAEDVFGAIAVMDIEIKDGHPLQTMYCQSMGSGAGNIVVEAKTHCGAGLGMMSRRPYTAKCIVHLAAQHQISGLHGGPRRPLRGFQRVGVHGRIGINECVSLAGRQGSDLVQVGCVVHSQQRSPLDPRRLMHLHLAQ